MDDFKEWCFMLSLSSHILFGDYSSFVKMHYVILSRNDHKVQVDHAYHQSFTFWSLSLIFNVQPTETRTLSKLSVLALYRFSRCRIAYLSGIVVRLEIDMKFLMVAFMLSLLWVADAGKFTLNWSKKITELNNLLPLGYFRLKLAETTYNAVLLNNGWTPFQQPLKLCVLRTHRRNITVFEGCRFSSLIFRILTSKFRKLLGHFLRYLYFLIFFSRIGFPSTRIGWTPSLNT